MKFDSLQAHSTNLQLLDLSNVSTVAASHGILHIEKLQNGCSALKVLRVTNSHLTLSCATLEEQVIYCMSYRRFFVQKYLLFDSDAF